MFGTIDKTGMYADDRDFRRGWFDNVLEFAFNTNPTISSDDYTPVMTVTQEGEDDYMTFTYRQRIGGVGTDGVDYVADGIMYTIEHDIDLLGSWSTGGLVMVGDPIPNNDGVTETVTVRMSVPMTGSKGFMRLKVTPME